MTNRNVPKIAEMIFRVRLKQITVDQAVEELGISRKTYYEMEGKALLALNNSLEPGKPGRPSKEVDLEKEELRRQLAETQKQLMLAEQDIEIRNKLFGTPAEILSESKKNVSKNSAKRARKKRKQRTLK